jgi:hypothetical protein
MARIPINKINFEGPEKIILHITHNMKIVFLKYKILSYELTSPS